LACPLCRPTLIESALQLLLVLDSQVTREQEGLLPAPEPAQPEEASEPEGTSQPEDTAQPEDTSEQADTSSQETTPSQDTREQGATTEKVYQPLKIKPRIQRPLQPIKRKLNNFFRSMMGSGLTFEYFKQFYHKTNAQMSSLTQT